MDDLTFVADYVSVLGMGDSLSQRLVAGIVSDPLRSRIVWRSVGNGAVQGTHGERKKRGALEEHASKKPAVMRRYSLM